MDATTRYLRLKPRIIACACKHSYGNESMADEMESVADLAFWLAYLKKDKCRIKLNNFLSLACHNSMSNYRRTHSRYVRRHVLMSNSQLDRYKCPHSLPASLDGVSSDAKATAWVIIHYGMKEAKRKLYREIGFDRTWDAVDEIKEALR